MPETIPNLWPHEFKIDVQTPLTILRVQANLLSKVTRGILEGVVETETSNERVQHRLVIVAPAYNGYRHTLFAVLHNPILPYPAEVRARVLAEEVERIDSTGIDVYRETVYPVANSDEQMQTLVGQALQSEETKAAILSLIAKSNEARQSPSTIPQNGKGHSEREGNENCPPVS